MTTPQKQKRTPAQGKPSAPPATPSDFDALVASIVHIHQHTQHVAAKAVNVVLTLRNWLIGYRIEVYERQGVDRAAYGDKLMDTLAKRLVKQGWARCDRRELYRFRQLYLTYPQIVESLTPQSPLAHPELIPACLPKGLALFKTLCRHYWTLAQQATVSYVHACREMWADEGQSDTNKVNP